MGIIPAPSVRPPGRARSARGWTMPAGPRPRRDLTDDWDRRRRLAASPEQDPYELLRPIVLFGQPPAAHARETGVPARALPHAAAPRRERRASPALHAGAGARQRITPAGYRCQGRPAMRPRGVKDVVARRATSEGRPVVASQIGSSAQRAGRSSPGRSAVVMTRASWGKIFWMSTRWISGSVSAQASARTNRR